MNPKYLWHYVIQPAVLGSLLKFQTQIACDEEGQSYYPPYPSHLLVKILLLNLNYMGYVESTPCWESACVHVFVGPHLPSCLSSDHAPRWVDRRECVLCVCPRQSNRQAGAHGADCLAAKEVLRPVVLPHPSTPHFNHPVQLRRCPGTVSALVHTSPCQYTGRVEGEVTSMAPRWSPSCPADLRPAILSPSLSSLFYLSHSLPLSQSNVTPNWIEKEMWKRAKTGTDRREGTRGEERGPV